MRWISLKEQLPPSDTFILLTDEVDVISYYVSDVGLFVTENKDPLPTITTQDQKKHKTTKFTHWAYLPEFE